MPLPQGIASRRTSDEYGSTQFGHVRATTGLLLAGMSHEPERMVSITGAEARHHAWSLRREGATTVEYLPNERSLKLGVGTAEGDRVTYRQDAFNVYVPGAQQRPVMTAMFGPVNADQIIRVGYFDDNDGLGFYRLGSERGVFVRTSTAGTMSETPTPIAGWINQVAAASWDPAKDNIFEMPFGWLSAGNPEWFINHVLAHRLETIGAFDVPWCRRANLPLSYEVENLAATTAGGYVKAICARCESEGTATLPGEVFSIERSAAVADVDTTGRPILSIRTAPTIAVGTLTGLDNRGIYIPVAFFARGTSGAGIVECRLNPGTLTGASFAATDDPGIQVDEAATAISGAPGRVVGYDTFDTTNAAVACGTPLSDSFSYPGRALHNYAFSGGQTLTIHARAITGTVSVTAGIRWRRIG